MSLIPSINIHDFFDFINLKFKLQNFDIPEIQYVSGNISFFETVVICLLCKNVNPDNVLEFGTFNGKTTVNIAVNTKDSAKIITVDLPKDDIDKTIYPLVKDNDDELGYIGLIHKAYHKYNPTIKNKIEQLWMDSALFPIEKYENYFDLIFIDASHSYENVINDSINAKKCIKNKKFILWHDYNGWDGVTKALNEIYQKSEHKWNYAHIQNTSMVIYYANFN